MIESCRGEVSLKMQTEPREGLRSRVHWRDKNPSCPCNFVTVACRLVVPEIEALLPSPSKIFKLPLFPQPADNTPVPSDAVWRHFPLGCPPVEPCHQSSSLKGQRLYTKLGPSLVGPRVSTGGLGLHPPTMLE